MLVPTLFLSMFCLFSCSVAFPVGTKLLTDTTNLKTWWLRSCWLLTFTDAEKNRSQHESWAVALILHRSYKTWSCASLWLFRHEVLSGCNITLWKFQAYFGLMCWTWPVPACFWLLNLCGKRIWPAATGGGGGGGVLQGRAGWGEQGGGIIHPLSPAQEKLFSHMDRTPVCKC